MSLVQLEYQGKSPGASGAKSTPPIHGPGLILAESPISDGRP